MQQALTHTGQSFGTKGYRTFVLLTLTLVYILNFVDRIIISVIARPIIEEFGLSNFQFGILTGVGFALFYTTLGIPIARLSERVSRVRVIGICCLIWSVATVLCGYTTGFLTLLLARLAVGVGEAGCSPQANSLISDYYKRELRPSALGIYAIGVMAGIVLAQLLGGYILNHFTWREAFIYIGAPGVILGVIVLLTIKEPPRGYSEPPGVKPLERATLKDALLELADKPSFWIMATGASIAIFAGYALTSFRPLFIQYEYGYSPGDTAIKFMAPFAMAGVFGTILGGYLTQHFSKTTVMAPIWVPAVSLAICAPLTVIGFLTDNITVMFISFTIAFMFQSFFYGSQFNITQAVVSVRVRATAIAILLFMINFIGYGFGPPTIGFLADILTSSKLSALGAPDILTAKCNLSDPALSEDLLTMCGEAKSYAMRYACAVAASLYLLAGGLFLLSGRTYRNDANLP